MGEILRVFTSAASLVMSMARSVASGIPSTILCAGALMTWAGLAVGQEEATVAQRPAANSNTISFLMRTVTADLSNTDEQRINADDKLRAVFDGREQVTMFEMTKLISGHMK